MHHHVRLAACTSFVVLAFSIVASCTAPQKKAATEGIDLADAACRVLDATQQDEPEWLKIACTVLEAGASTIKEVIVRLPMKSPAARMLRDGAGAKAPRCMIPPAGSASWSAAP